MTNGHSRGRPPRTVLEQKIWERGETLAEFVEYAERFARDHGERGTLSERNLKRLIAGRKPDGSLISPPRHATARLLECILGIDIKKLLSSPETIDNRFHKESERELRHRLGASRQVNGPIIQILNNQLDAIRRLDRQLGALVTIDEVNTKIEQVTLLLSHSLTPSTRARLAAVRAELGTLVGWQTLDLGEPSRAWQHYEQAVRVANEAGSSEFRIHAAAGRAFALLDLGKYESAQDLISATRTEAKKTTSRLLQAWLAAAHGEVLAAGHQSTASLRAFDRSLNLLAHADADPNGPYVALDEVHLIRWRGHALARINHHEAVPVLTATLSRLDPTFKRAEAGLRVDLAVALAGQNEQQSAMQQLIASQILAEEVGSIRHERRTRRLEVEVSNGL